MFHKCSVYLVQPFGIGLLTRHNSSETPPGVGLWGRCPPAAARPSATAAPRVPEVVLGCFPGVRAAVNVLVQVLGMMFARGLKRKSAEEPEDVEGCSAGAQAMPSYSLQRQSLLDMSLVKLQLCHMLVEPNLCRSVLIANTVRQIQEEMTRDGTWRAVAPQAAGRAPLDRLVATDILCRSVREQEGECPAPDMGDGQPDLVPGLAVAPAAQAPRSPQSSLWEGDGSRESRGGFQKSLDQIFETLESKTSGSVEELFADVDSSYYDLDAVLTGMVGSTSSGPGSGLQAFASAATSPPSSSCRSDLGELDHAVEILVET
ncbi:cell division cycle-associated protein 4 isoform X1 [Mustela lutreola]|uniref:cell division cycle-associated protein 4 isoform X1 n=2 Tax=Mustela lutreola TaxID=9666 RepID=UPI00279700B2|nr:cell division cycle-associated protein 4 isoform X1 [Mustela lutreola]